MRIIAGLAGGRRLRTLNGRHTRPTADRVKEAMFSVLAPCLPGARVLDACAGSAALGLEALSRGAASALFIESNRRAADIAAANIAAINLPGARLLRGDALKLLPKLAEQEERFDLIFLDPPYDTGLLRALLRLIGESGLLAVDGLVVAETAAKSGEAAMPQLWEERKCSVYGDTAIHYLRIADIQGGE